MGDRRAEIALFSEILAHCGEVFFFVDGIDLVSSLYALVFCSDIIPFVNGFRGTLFLDSTVILRRYTYKYLKPLSKREKHYLLGDSSRSPRSVLSLRQR